MIRPCLVLLLAAGLTWSAAPPLSEPLPAGARLRIGTPRLRHGGLVRALAFSPDGALLASASHDQTVSVWEVPAGHERFRCKGHEADTLCVVFSPDGRLLASGGADGTVRLWNTVGKQAGLEVHRFRFAAEAVEAVAFSPDGKTLAMGGDDGIVHLIDLATRQATLQLTQERGVHTLAWSADGKVLATNSARHAVTLWNPTTGKAIANLGEDTVQCLAFAPEGRTLISREAGGVFRLWDLTRATQTRQWRGSEKDVGGAGSAIYQIAFSSNGATLYSGNLAGQLEAWDVATGKLRESFRDRHHGRVTAVAVASRSGLVATGGADHAIHLWRPGKGAATAGGEFTGPLLGLALPARGEGLAVLVGTGEVRTYDRRSGRAGARYDRVPAQAIAYNRDGTGLTVGAGLELGTWNLRKDGWTLLERSESAVTAVGYAANGKSLVTAHQDGAIWLREVGGKRRRVCEGKVLRMHPVVSPDGGLVAAVGREAQIRMWDGVTGKAMRALGGHRGGTLTAAFSPDGKWLVSGGRDHLLRIWDVVRGVPVRTPSAHDAWVCATAFSPDGKMIASGTVRGDVQLWGARTGRLIGELEGHRGAVTGLAFADERTLVSTSMDATATSWDVGDVSETRVRLLPLTPGRREQSWQDLRDTRTVVVSLAMQKLARDPAGLVALVRERLRPVDGKLIAECIRDLDAGEYATRKRAYDRLEGLGRSAEGPMRQALARKPGLEVFRRLEELVNRSQAAEPSAVEQQAMRAVEVLEMIGTAGARAVLEKLASGAAEAELTRKAKGALERMGKKG